MILVIDNYDSFTYNLVQYLGELGADMKVVRNNMACINDIKKWEPERIVISPGPGRPGDAGISKEVITEFMDRIPILGVCLGHQCIGEVLGGRVVRAKRLMHGKTSMIYHNKKGIFTGIPNPFKAARYHSLIVDNKSIPPALRVTARTDTEEIMGIRHKVFPLWGVQFHPESILTREGKKLLKNFLEI